MLTGGVWDTFLAVPLLLDREPRSLAVLGNAGGTVARAFGVYWPRVDVDGVEIDPAVTDAGFRYFGLGDNPRLRAHDADARPFLRATDERYDLVYVDAYHQPYVPFYLATREFFRARPRAARARRARRAQRRDRPGRPAARATSSRARSRPSSRRCGSGRRSASTASCSA